MKRLLPVLAVSALLAPVAASGHGRTGLAKGFVSTVAALKPNVLGVSVVVLGGDDRLRLSNYSGKTIIILGYQGESRTFASLIARCTRTCARRRSS